MGVFVGFLTNISFVWILTIPIHSKEKVNETSFMTRCVGKEFAMSKPGSEHRDCVVVFNQ